MDERCARFEKEAEVVYLLVQVRKDLEQDEELGASLSTLSFYYDWVLYHELGGNAAQTFIKTIYPRLE